MLNPYLFYSGNCEAAFKYYEKVLGGKIEMMLRSDEAPESMPATPGWEKKIMHARMTVGDQVLMASDAPPGRRDDMKGFSVALQIPDPAEAERVFHALADKGTVQLPIQETFWARRFGMLVDQFGTPWMINCEKPM